MAKFYKSTNWAIEFTLPRSLNDLLIGQLPFKYQMFGKVLKLIMWYKSLKE